MHQIRGRSLTENDVAEIRQVIADHWYQGRSAISRELCQRWQWRHANGQLKDMACRSLLLPLEKKGELTLPPRMQETYSPFLHNGHHGNGRRCFRVWLFDNQDGAPNP